MDVYLTEIDGVQARGTVHTAENVALGFPPTMLGVTASHDGESHADIGAVSDDQFYLCVCNHGTRDSAVVRLTRAELNHAG
jgi:hypothetical protein